MAYFLNALYSIYCMQDQTKSGDLISEYSGSTAVSNSTVEEQSEESFLQEIKVIMSENPRLYEKLAKL